MSGDSVSPETSHALRVLSFAMGSGLAIFAGIVWFYAGHDAAIPDAGVAHRVNTMTRTAMILALALIVASEFVWRTLIKAEGSLDSRVRTAFIVRLSMREGAALLGLAVAFLAARSGVLRLYPAYWANLAPFGLFLIFLYAHWPTPQKLEAEARVLLGS